MHDLWENKLHLFANTFLPVRCTGGKSKPRGENRLRGRFRGTGEFRLYFVCCCFAYTRRYFLEFNAPMFMQDVMDYFRGIVAVGERSERALGITQEVRAQFLISMTSICPQLSHPDGTARSC